MKLNITYAEKFSKKYKQQLEENYKWYKYPKCNEERNEDALPRNLFFNQKILSTNIYSSEEKISEEIPTAYFLDIT